MGEAILALPSRSPHEVSSCHCSHVSWICSVICCVIQEYAFTLSTTHTSITHSDALNQCASYSKSQPRCLIGASPAIVTSESDFVWDRENSVFLLCLCLWREVWEGTSEGLFLPVVVICIESLKVESRRCCFYTCARLSSNMPFLPKCSRNHSHFPTRLSSVLWSMYGLSSPQPGRWKWSGYSRNPDCSLFRRFRRLLLQSVQEVIIYWSLFGRFRRFIAVSSEGNGNPLQCACLENPRDGRAWWAAVYGVARVGHEWSDLAA